MCLFSFMIYNYVLSVSISVMTHSSFILNAGSDTPPKSIQTAALWQVYEVLRGRARLGIGTAVNTSDLFNDSLVAICNEYHTHVYSHYSLR